PGSRRRRRSSSTGERSAARSIAPTTTTRSSSSSTPGTATRARARAEPRPERRGTMELSEDSKYRLAYLTLRLAFDRKLTGADPGGQPGLLAFLDVLAGTQLAADAGGKRYASQREKIESSSDA